MIDHLAAVRDAAREVFKELGSGHSEAVYETALELELRLRGMTGPMMRQVPCPIRYKGHTVGIGYIDMLVGEVLVVELKAVAKLTGRDETQVMKYLGGMGLETGLLINFNQVSGEVESAEVSRVGSPTQEGGPLTIGLPFGPETTAMTTNTTITYGATWNTDPPDPSLVGAAPSPLPPTLSGGQALVLPHESSE